MHLNKFYQSDAFICIIYVIITNVMGLNKLYYFIYVVYELKWFGCEWMNYIKSKENKSERQTRYLKYCFKLTSICFELTFTILECITNWVHFEYRYWCNEVCCRTSLADEVFSLLNMSFVQSLNLLWSEDAKAGYKLITEVMGCFIQCLPFIMGRHIHH